MGVEQAETGQVEWVPDPDSSAFIYTRHPGQETGRAYFRLPEESHVWEVGTTTLALVGEVYGPRDAVPARYASGGIDALSLLDGSFLIFVTDTASNDAWVVTDHIGSRAAYRWEQGDTTMVTNTLAAGPRSGADLDPGGVCAFLANDGVRSGLTPWSTARALRPASITALHPDGSDRHYWRMRAAPEPGDLDDLAVTMHHLMLSSVERRLAAFGDTPIALSLSGGVDSKGLLGLLLECVPAERISAYTYFYGEQVGDMDLPEAQRAARSAGVVHHSVLGYQGDFLATLIDNAIRGDGVAHFCDDADAWGHLADKYGGDGLVVAGDRQSHHLGRLPRDLPIPSLLRLVSLYPGSVIEWFLARLPDDSSRAMIAAWDDVYGDLVAEYSTMGNWRIAAHPAYIEQRANPTLTLWRERFSRRAGSVISPFLDRQLLDFVGRLPFAFNDVEGDFLHRITLERAYPAIFSGDNAHGGWNVPDWGEEIRVNVDAIRAMVVGIDSPLESLIPKSVTLDLLNAVASSDSPVGTATSGWKWQLRKLVKTSEVLTRLARERKLQQRLAAPMKVGEAALLRRLLTLHLALADHSAVMERFEEVRHG
jgi:asparagine synthase (glutamine-hydrolysing)